MKNTLLGILAVIVVVIVAVVVNFIPRGYKEVDAPRNNSNYRIMSYNLKNAASDLEAFDERKEAIVELFNKYEPSSFGVQEADEAWMEYLPGALENYDYVGVGRDDGDTNGEYAAVFYLKDQFNVLDSGSFWISETPNIPSYGWDANNIRICTYVVLEDVSTGEIFVHMNTHLDHIGEEARRRGVELLIEKSEQFYVPIVITGDFNFLQGSTYYKDMLDSEFDDSKKIADSKVAFGTINYFTKFHFRLAPPIDFLFVSGFDVDHYEVVYRDRVNGLPLSDHFPIFIDVNLSPS